MDDSNIIIYHDIIFSEIQTTTATQNQQPKQNHETRIVMMQQKATLFAQEWETPGLPKADNGNEGDATKFNRSVGGSTEGNQMKETTVPKKGKQKSGARTK